MASDDSAEETFTVRVPGTTSNLGPGFDRLGVALDLWTHSIEVRTADSTSPTHPMVEEALAVFYATPPAAGLPRCSLRWDIGGDVPVSRGPGSSVTLRLGILAGIIAIHGSPLQRNDLFRLCSDLEGHPDNAGPAVYVEFFVGGPGGSHFSFPVDPGLRFVLLIRQHDVLTDEARLVRPPHIDFSDAVENVGRAAAVTAAFATGDHASLSGLLKDHLHEPYRAALDPRLGPIIRAGETAGALGGVLSGSGSTVICLTHEAERAAAIGEGMGNACEDADAPGIRVAWVDNHGMLCQSSQEGSAA